MAAIQQRSSRLAALLSEAASVLQESASPRPPAAIAAALKELQVSTDLHHSGLRTVTQRGFAAMSTALCSPAWLSGCLPGAVPHGVAPSALRLCTIATQSAHRAQRGDGGAARAVLSAAPIQPCSVRASEGESLGASGAVRQIGYDIVGHGGGPQTTDGGRQQAGAQHAHSGDSRRAPPGPGDQKAQDLAKEILRLKTVGDLKGAAALLTIKLLDELQQNYVRPSCFTFIPSPGTVVTLLYCCARSICCLSLLSQEVLKQWNATEEQRAGHSMLVRLSQVT